MSFCWFRLAAALSFASFAVAAAADPQNASVPEAAVVDASGVAPAPNVEAAALINAAAVATPQVAPSVATGPAADAGVPPDTSAPPDTAVPTATAAAVETDAAASTAAADSPSPAPAVAPAPAGAGPNTSYSLADRVVVRKAQRRLYLMQADRVIAEYPIRLGLNPVGPKQREGDFRTPEGTYLLTRRNQASDFFLSIGVSYPNDRDMARARGQRVAPGGSIMIHGQPNFPRKSSDYYVRNDWTDGCIAVSNSDMVDIWLRTRIGLPIEIRP